MKTPEERATEVVEETSTWLPSEMHAFIVKHINEAVAEATACPIPLPVDAARFDQLMEFLDKQYPAEKFGARTWPYDMRCMKQQIDHLTALVRDMAQDPTSAVLLDHGDRMYRLGAGKERERIVAVLRKCGCDVDGIYSAIEACCPVVETMSR